MNAVEYWFCRLSMMLENRSCSILCEWVNSMASHGFIGIRG